MTYLNEDTLVQLGLSGFEECNTYFFKLCVLKSLIDSVRHFC